MNGAPWCGHEPRAWQREAHMAVRQAISGGKASVVVHAVMGAGKSLLIAELAAEHIGDGVVVVSTSSQRLVEQLSTTLLERLPSSATVGRYYSRQKSVMASVIVTTMDSFPRLVSALDGADRTCRLWIADEAHRTEIGTALEALEQLAPTVSVGFTATPFRAKKTEELSVFTDMVYSYGPEDAIKDAVVVPWRIVPWEGGEVPLDEACVQMALDGKSLGPGLTNAVSIADAEAFAEMLVAAGMRADVVHSKLKQDRVDKALVDLRSGELDILVHVSMLQEGVDLPWLRWGVLRRPVGSPVRFAQEVGRFLRSDEGKTEAVLYDPNDLFGTHSLSREAVLRGGAEEDASAPTVPVTDTGEPGWYEEMSGEPHAFLRAGIGVDAKVRVHRWRRPSPYETVRVERIDGRRIFLGDLATGGPMMAVRLIESPRARRAREAVHAAESAMEDHTAVSLTPIAVYLRGIAIELEQAGIAQRTVASRSWRQRGPTRAQFDLVRSLSGRIARVVASVPAEDRAAMRAAMTSARLLDRGAMSDMVTVALAIVKNKGWPLVAAEGMQG